MTNGTASSGLYVEFQAAVLRQLPRPEDLTKGDLERLLSDQASLRQSLRRAVLPIKPGPTSSQERAQRIMGQNFVDPAWLEKKLSDGSLHFQLGDLEILSTVPFSEEVLERCRYTHILFPGLPVSIARLRGLANGLLTDNPDCRYCHSLRTVRRSSGGRSGSRGSPRTWRFAGTSFVKALFRRARTKAGTTSKSCSIRVSMCPRPSRWSSPSSSACCSEGRMSGARSYGCFVARILLTDC